MPFVNFWEINSLLCLRFSPEFRCSNISAVTEHTRNQIFLMSYPKIFFLQNLHFGPFRCVPRRLLKISIIYSQLHCILIWYFWVFFENYSMRMLSIRGNDFIAHWAYKERISAHAHLAVKCERFTCTIHAEHTRNEFYRTLNIRVTNFFAWWACAEPISCLKVEYLGRIEYDFKKSRVAGPWDQMVSVSAKKY